MAHLNTGDFMLIVGQLGVRIPRNGEYPFSTKIFDPTYLSERPNKAAWILDPT
jgi:hypothetical protein